MIGIVNYGSGNVWAIANIYKMHNIAHVVSHDIEELEMADKLILPGVGAFDETMKMIEGKGLKNWLDRKVTVEKIPILGVCVGMQVMAKESEEGKRKGFGWVDATVKKFDPSLLARKPHLPHLGWNDVKQIKPHSLMEAVKPERGFYFLHSYYCECANEADVLTTTSYGIDFVSAFCHENVFGFQFHPEKSHQNGEAVLLNFAKI